MFYHVFVAILGVFLLGGGWLILQLKFPSNRKNCGATSCLGCFLNSHCPNTDPATKTD